MTNIILTTGLPASGKSTWAKQKVAEANGALVRVNLDDLRTMLDIDPAANDAATKELIKVMYSIHDQAILSAVAAGKNVVVDNTHLNKTLPNRIKKLFDGDVNFMVADFTGVPMEACLTRDALRTNSVGADVIRGMAKQLNKPWRLTSEFMNDYEYPLIPDNPEITDPAGFDREPVIVFDIDGTLARHHRSPYDYSRLGTDSVFEHIAQLARNYYALGYDILVVSGRPDTYFAETAQWLRDNGIPYTNMHMRRADDNRNDADVKHEIFDKYIRPYYWVENWFDDRDRVVRRLRKLGINVSQVAYGNF